LLQPEWESLQTAASALPGCNGSEEDVLTYAMFPQVAPGFFDKRAQGPINLGREPKAVEKSTVPGSAHTSIQTAVTYDVKLNGRSHRVSVTPIEK
jgi:methylmalonyl-CoA carboxyltransferase 5S subunit